MVYKYRYVTPEGFSDMLMNSDGEYLTGLWFEDSKDAGKHILNCEEKLLPVFLDTIKWLDIYFAGKVPDFRPKYIVQKLTPFRQAVIEEMLRIPYGETSTYGAIAKSIAAQKGIARMSSRAVGGAVGWNPLCLIIPCHRVVGTNNSLTGYGGGIKNKIGLLALEKLDMSKFTVPQKGTAL